MGLEQIRSLADELNNMIPEFGDTIYTCSENTINYIKKWEPNFIYYIESIVSDDPITINKKETKPTEEQLEEIYNLAIDLYVNKSITLLNSYLNYLKEEKDINIEAVQNYVTQFSSLMQLITLPNFDTKMVESLKKYKCITQDNIFYLLDDMLNETINWVLADGASFNGKVFDIYKHENVEGFILHNSLDEWASSYYSILAEYEGRPDPVEKKAFPSVTYDLILEFNKSKDDVPTEIQTIIKDISKINSDIINFLTYKDFEETNKNPTTPDANTITPPDKESLLTKVYTKHKVNDMYIYLGYPDKCMYTKEEEARKTRQYHKSLNITREGLLAEVAS